MNSLCPSTHVSKSEGFDWLHQMSQSNGGIVKPVTCLFCFIEFSDKLWTCPMPLVLLINCLTYLDLYHNWWQNYVIILYYHGSVIFIYFMYSAIWICMPLPSLHIKVTVYLITVEIGFLLHLWTFGINQSWEIFRFTSNSACDKLTSISLPLLANPHHSKIYGLGPPLSQLSAEQAPRSLLAALGSLPWAAHRSQFVPSAFPTLCTAHTLSHAHAKLKPVFNCFFYFLRL